MVCNFCICVGNTRPPVEGEYPSWEGGLFNISMFRKNASKYAELMVESHDCDNYKEMLLSFSFVKKKKKLQNRKSSARYTFMIFCAL